MILTNGESVEPDALPFEQYDRRPGQVKAVQMKESFIVIVGDYSSGGNAGDYLCQLDEHDFYAVEREKFESLYTKPEPEQ